MPRSKGRVGPVEQLRVTGVRVARAAAADDEKSDVYTVKVHGTRKIHVCSQQNGVL